MHLRTAADISSAWKSTGWMIIASTYDLSLDGFCAAQTAIYPKRLYWTRAYISSRCYCRLSGTIPQVRAIIYMECMRFWHAELPPAYYLLGRWQHSALGFIFQPAGWHAILSRAIGIQWYKEVLPEQNSASRGVTTPPVYHLPIKRRACRALITARSLYVCIV